MAKYWIQYDEKGAEEKRLTFAGKEYVCRTGPFIDGIARGLDLPINEQVKADYPDEEDMLELINDMVNDFADAQTVLPELTEMEPRLTGSKAEKEDD